ncbi:MAG: type II toxin-antitoxin system HicB family antitoxin [Chloroflexota bacterium]
MTDKPLPRKRKVTLPAYLEKPPKAFRVRPYIKKKRIVTGFRIEDSERKAIKNRAAVIKHIRDTYPEISVPELENASIGYADVKLTCIHEVHSEEVNPYRDKFAVILEPEEDRGYLIHCPVLSGCSSQGDSLEKALNNIREVICIRRR